jgi:hypothetical protein
MKMAKGNPLRVVGNEGRGRGRKRESNKGG